MPKLTLELRQIDISALAELAIREVRDVHQQGVYIIRRALQTPPDTYDSQVRELNYTPPVRTIQEARQGAHDHIQEIICDQEIDEDVADLLALYAIQILVHELTTNEFYELKNIVPKFPQ